MRWSIPPITTMGDAECDDLCLRKILRIVNDRGRSFKKMRVAAHGGHPIFFSGCMTIRYITVKANPVVLIANLKGIDGQIGRFYGVQLGTQALSQVI
jgi:hypothetical protein